ncbi:helix-turn-helix domain-containing protein, partial [Nocardioides sp.]|uniref:helix-turn-helix domain-containing protein n=1 Tax=Nocardioides sp. TaxID=35761 RepID=UPI00273774FB
MSEAAGTLIREWRQRRNVSQLDLANRAGVSTRHVSFVETGRSRPTSAMILRLCDQLAVPLREQNRVLLAGGFAPIHPEHGLAEPPMAQVSEAISAILTGHLPYPALVVDQAWSLVDANDAIYALIDGVAAHLLEPPVNVIRLTLHPDGLASRVVNLAEWRDHLLTRLRQEYDATGDGRLRELLDEIRSLGPGDPPAPAHHGERHTAGLVVPFRLRAGDDILSLFSTTTVFGTPREVTLSELAIEAFYPADEATRELL